MKNKKPETPENPLLSIEISPAEITVGKKAEDVDFSKWTPEEQWKFRLRGAELGVLLASRGAGILSIAGNSGDKTLAPYEALPLAHEGMEKSDKGAGLIERIRNLSDEYNSLVPSAWPAEQRKALNEILEKLEQSFNVLLDSEIRLHRLGWKFDRKKGRLKHIDKHEGRDLFGDVVWGVYQARHAGKEPTPEVCQDIAEILSTNYPASKLGTGSHDPVYRAIYNRKYRKI